MAYDYERVTKGMPSLLTYTCDDGNIICIVMNKNLSVIPYWLYQNEALFNPLTPPEARAAMFNVTIAQKYKEGHKTYANEITYHADKKMGPFLRIDLTVVGQQMAQQQDYRTKGRKVKTKDRYDPTAPNAEALWASFKAPLRRALTQLGLQPV